MMKRIRSYRLLFCSIGFSSFILIMLSDARAQVKATASPPLSFDHSHEAHKILDCTRCHVEGASSSVIRPGGNTHLLCAGSGCHQMYGEPRRSLKTTLVCRTCHLEDEPWQVRADRMQPFPDPSKRGKTHCTSFPHKRHIKLLKSSRDLDTKELCRSCHVSRDEGALHEQCIGCHESTPSTSKAHSFVECASCHTLRGKSESDLCTVWVKNPYSVRDRFDHAVHDLDTRTDPPSPLSCGHCHLHIAQHDGVASRGTQRIRILDSGLMYDACNACHNRRIRSPRTGKTLFATYEKETCHKCPGKKKSQFSAKEREAHKSR